MKSPRIRLDELLLQHGQVSTREKARALILSGRVQVPGVTHPKPGLKVAAQTELRVTPGADYVSRAGVKLAHALDRFGVDPAGWVCADIGASTGGFTGCLLRRGAARVYAVDVGYGQLDWALRQDERVVVLDRTNARYLESLPEAPTLVVIDVSFISLRLILPAAERVSPTGVEVVALVKPQFEAGRGQIGKGGIIRDPDVHAEVLHSLDGWLSSQKWRLVGLTPSPITGAGGNVEFLAHLRPGAHAPSDPDTSRGAMIERALEAVTQVISGEREP